MNKSRLEYLYKQYQAKQLSEQERIEWGTILKDHSNDSVLQDLLESAWNSNKAVITVIEESDVLDIYKYVIAQPQQKRPFILIKMWPQITSVAAVLLIAFGVYFYNSQEREREIREIRIARNIPPGDNKAILTLADGRTINLSDAQNGNVAKQAGISVSKTKNGELIYSVEGNRLSADNSSVTNTISTPRGGQYQVSLPDGSRVWLNAASSLSFPIHFSKMDRRVYLQGEAYFEIAKNKRQPFFVQTDQQEVKVLGTHFNIHAYNTETATITTLIEGAVGISFKNNKLEKAILKPGQQALLNGTDNVSIVDADIDQAMAWKNGFFMFNGEKLEAIMTQVSRWYDVEVCFKDNKIKNRVFRGTISRFKNISNLLEVLESTGSVKFKVEGRRITAM